MINSKKIIFILLIISSALATKNAFSASRVADIAKLLCELSKPSPIGKRTNSGDNAPAGIAEPDVPPLPTTEDIFDLDRFYLAIPDKGVLAIPRNPFKKVKTTEEKKAARRAAEDAHRDSLSSDELAKIRVREAAAKAERLAKRLAEMTAKQRAEYNEKNAQAQAERLGKRLAKMTDEQRAEYNKRNAQAEAARLAKKTDEQRAESNRKKADAKAKRLASMTAKQRAEYDKRNAEAQAARRAKKKAVQAGTL